MYKGHARQILLPKLHDGTGEIGGVYYAVVCITSLCVPWIVTRFPWKLLQRVEQCFTFFIKLTPGIKPILHACEQGALTVVKELYK